MDINRLIDSTLLRPEATRAQVIKLCEDALEHGFASVCVNPYYVDVANAVLAGSDVGTCVVIGFPLGATGSSVKVAEAEYVLDRGARELDMVMNVGALKSGEPGAVEDDIKSVVERCARNALVKVILECSLLSDGEIVEACRIAVAAGADFVKTSTGFGPGGATVHDVQLLKSTVAGHALVKASGGIGDLATAMAMVDAGADRIGTSQGVAIAIEAARRDG